MGLLDAVIGALGATQQPGSPGGQGPQGDLLQAVLALLAQRGSGGLGGLDGLLARFQEGGLGDVAASWIGHGSNLPVSPDQLREVLGSDTLSRVAEALGVPQQEAAGQLSQWLPDVVDRLTPGGALPQGDAPGLGDLGQLLDRFSR